MDQESRRNRVIGLSALLGATFTYGWFGVLARYIGTDLPLFYQTAVRSVVTCILFFLFLVFAKKCKKMSLRDWGWTAIRSIFDLGATIMAFISFNHLPIG